MKAWNQGGGSDLRLDDIGEIPPLTAEEIRAARLHVLSAARDAADATELMEMLGVGLSHCGHSALKVNNENLAPARRETEVVIE